MQRRCSLPGRPGTLLSGLRLLRRRLLAQVDLARDLHWRRIALLLISARHDHAPRHEHQDADHEGGGNHHRPVELALTRLLRLELVELLAHAAQRALLRLALCADFVDGAAYVGWLFRGHLIDSSDLRKVAREDGFA